MPRIWNLNEMFGFSSTLSLPTVTLPAYSVASASTVGPRRLQGPHHSAQKPTSTEPLDLITVSSKLLSVKVCTAVCTFSVAIISPVDPGRPGSTGHPPPAGRPHPVEPPARIF